MFKVMFKNIIWSILVAISCLVARGEEDNVLLWMFNDPVITDFDGSTYKADTLVGRGEAEGKQVNAVRVATVGSNGEKVYLDLFYSADGEHRSYDEVPYVWDDGLKENMAGPAYADLSGISLNDTSMAFLMEIGYATLDGDKLTEWIVMASASESLQNMISGGHINASELSYEGNMPWTVTGMSVPEPNSAILIFIGSCILMLMRPRKMMYNQSVA